MLHLFSAGRAAAIAGDQPLAGVVTLGQRAQHLGLIAAVGHRAVPWIARTDGSHVLERPLVESATIRLGQVAQGALLGVMIDSPQGDENSDHEGRGAEQQCPSPSIGTRPIHPSELHGVTLIPGTRKLDARRALRVLLGTVAAVVASAPAPAHATPTTVMWAPSTPALQGDLDLKPSAP